MTSESTNHSFRYAMILIGVIVITPGAIYLARLQDTQPTTFFVRSINDASYNCEDKIKDRFGSSLLSSNFDQYSSRYDADDGQYIIYYRVSTQSFDKHNRPTINNHMAKCTVWETLGFVSSFQVFNEF